MSTTVIVIVIVAVGTLGWVTAAPTSGAAPAAGVLAWGNNQTGELADGTTTNRLEPVPSVGLSAPTVFSAGAVHGLAVNGGELLAWGHNKSGQLGDGTNDDRLTPVPVAGLADVVAVAAGNAFSIAALSDGSVHAWGNNESGQLGDGTAPSDHNTPVDVVGLGPGSGVTTVAAGDAHALALKGDGSVWAWGHNASGQLGDGTAPNDHATPVQVSGLGPGSGVVAIAAGSAFSLALKADGSVLAWGNNASGQLGDGTAPTDQPAPVAVAGLGAGSGVVKIVAGGATSYALRADGSMLAWGNNGAGELGDGNAPTDQHTPQTVPRLSGVVDIAAGFQHALALMSDGTVDAWGDNLLGQLGDGTTTKRPSPVKVSGINAGSGVGAVFAGGDHSHAVITPEGTPPTAPAEPVASGIVSPLTTGARSTSATNTGAPEAHAVNANPSVTG